jgi:hypothetical protein
MLHVERLARIIGCGVSTLPIKHLGLQLGASYKAKHIWDDVIEKLDYQLASWKMTYLSKGGRVTLIKSTIVNMPTY